ncbi:lonely Cys domain-containing protein, partial [Streptomyces hirsutus]|uniref:lonely Cys domain-containing protein n=1 Tax=Streptomyces hirsutus TaxID=35620 RepID=UPI0033FAE5FF
MSELDRTLNHVVFALTGERLPVADPNGALASREVLLELARGLRGLSGEVQSAVARVGAGMPRKAGEAYARSLRGLVDDGGANPLRQLADEVDKVAERRVLISMQVRESRIEILLEVSLLLAQIQMYLALSYFTGGVSLGAVAALRARAALRLLLALQALSHSVVPLVGAPLEALQEALQSVAARLLTMASAPAVGRPVGVDWRKVGQDALFGAFAGLFGEVLGGATSPVVEKLAKGVLGDKSALVVPLRVVNSGFVEGGAESLGEMFTVGVLQGRWAFSVQTAGSAGLSGVVTTVVLMGAAGLGKALHKAFFVSRAASFPSSYVPGSAGAGSGSGGVNPLGVLDGWGDIGAGLGPAGPAADLPLARPYDIPSVVTATPPPAVTPTVTPSRVTAAPVPSPALTAPPSASVPAPVPAPGSTPTTADMPSVPHPVRDTGGLPYGQPDVTSPRTPLGREPADNGAAPGGMPGTADDAPAAGGSPAPGPSRTGTADITGVLTGHDVRTTAPTTADDPGPAGEVPDTGGDRTGAVTPTAPPATAPSSQVQPSPSAVEPSPARATPGAAAPSATASAPDAAARNGSPHPETSQGPESSSAAPHETAADHEATVREGGPGPLPPSAGTAPGVPTAVPAVPAAPRVPGAQGEPVFVPLTGEEPSGALLSEALPGSDGSGQGGGRAWFTQEDMERRREHYGHLPAVRHRAIWDLAADQEGPLEALAGPDTAYTAALHIGARGAELPLSDGRTGVTDGRGLGRVLKRQPSLVRLGPDTELRLLACTAGEQPDGDPLARVPLGQDVATETGLVVHADTGEVALVGPSLGRPARIGVVDSLTTPRHRQTSFRPEPGPEELEAAAWRAGLAPGTDRPAERALRWLRALRQEAGPDLGWNPDRRHEYETLLRGAMAWENTRPATAAGPLTGPELTRLLEHHRLTHPGATLTRALTLAGSVAPASAPVTTSAAAPLAAPGTAAVPPLAEAARGTPSEPFPEPFADPGATLTQALTPAGSPAPAPATTSAAPLAAPATTTDPPRADTAVPEAEAAREVAPGPVPTPFADPLQYNSGRAPAPSFTDMLVDELVRAHLAAEPDRVWMTPAAQALTALASREMSAVDQAALDATVRAALSLEDETPVEAAQYLELLELLRDAAQEGRDGSTPALAAYYLEERGALDSGSMLREPGGWITGRSLRDGPSFTLDTSTVTMMEEDAAGGLSEMPRRRGMAPWTGATAYVLEAEGDAEGRRVRMRLTDGTQRWADGRVLAELLRNDPWLSSGMVVVLAVADAGGRGAVLPRLVADALGRDVWTPTGRLALADSGSPGDPRLLARITDRAGTVPVGRWLMTSPGTDPLPELDPTVYQILKDKSGTERLVPDGALDTYTLVRGGRSIGRTSFGLADQRTFEKADQSLSDLTEYVVVDPVLQAVREIRRVPWADLVAAGTPIWDFDAHGTTDGFILWKVGGHTMRGQPHDAGEWVRRRPSVTELDRRAAAGHTPWIRVQSCHFGALRKGTTDPLETPEPAQDFANAARHPVMAATSLVSTRDKSERYVSGVVAPYDDGPVEWRVFRPEPRDAELDALSRSMGVGSASTALRLVRALRRMFGPEADGDPDLVAGIGALERLRHSDPVLGAFGPLTMEFLDHTARTHAQNSAPSAGADLTTARRDLLRAAGRWLAHALTDRRGRRELTAYLPMPVPSRIAGEWNARGGDTLGQRVLDPGGARGSAPLTGADRARAFWALVRARETLDGFGPAGAVPGIVRGVLHLDANVTVTRADERAAVVRAAQAHTHGFPDAGPAAWAAYDLEQRGVWEAAGPIRSKGSGKDTGFSFAGRTAPVPDLDTTVYAVGPPGALRRDTDVPWEPSKSMVMEVAEVRGRSVVVHVRDGSAFITSHQVFAQWLAAKLPRHGDSRSVVLVGPVTATDRDDAAHALVRAVARATGRAVHMAPAGSSLTATPDGHLITVENGTMTGDWLTELPPRSQSPDLALNRLTTDGRSVGPARNARTGTDYGFDVRVLPLDIVPVGDLTVMVEFAPGPVPDTEREKVWTALTEGVEHLFNRPGHRIGRYRHRLRVTVEQVPPGQGAHMRVRLRDSGPMDRHRWTTRQPPAQYAVQIGRQLGLGSADPLANPDAWTPGPHGLTAADLITLQNLIGAGSPPAPGTAHSAAPSGRSGPA